MRANYRLQRLFVTAPLHAGATVPADDGQFNYLAHVLRLEDGAHILIFNGEDGEWRARLTYPTRKKIVLVAEACERPQTPRPELHYLFAPLKIGRMDYLIQKAVEMGAGVLQPVLTQHVQGKAPPPDKIRAQAIEAAEQCGILAVPEIAPAMRLADCLSGWDGTRRILFCDEDSATNNPLAALQAVRERRLALLIGPEGGFSDDERTLLRALPFVTAIPLGPRILRADTAAVAALAVIQATIGDWQ